MDGQLGHFEIGVPDPVAARAFYGPLFGWRFHSMGQGDERWIETSSIRGGLHAAAAGATMVVYFTVADLDEAMRKVAELGGRPGEPSPEEPGFGRFAACHDNQGVSFGLHQPPDS